MPYVDPQDSHSTGDREGHVVFSDGPSSGEHSGSDGPRPSEGPTGERRTPERNFGNVDRDSGNANREPGARPKAPEVNEPAVLIWHTSADSHSGTLEILDGVRTTSVEAHSGSHLSGIRVDKLAPGTYDIARNLLHGEVDSYRLEAHDSNYGNDEVDPPMSRRPFWSPDQAHVRLHVPGGSIGCLAIGAFNGDRSARATQQWQTVRAALDRSEGKRVWVEKMKGTRDYASTLGGLWGDEEIRVVGTLIVDEPRQ